MNLYSIERKTISRWKRCSIMWPFIHWYRVFLWPHKINFSINYFYSHHSFTQQLAVYLLLRNYILTFELLAIVSLSILHSQLYQFLVPNDVFTRSKYVYQSLRNWGQWGKTSICQNTWLRGQSRICSITIWLMWIGSKSNNGNQSTFNYLWKLGRGLHPDELAAIFNWQEHKFHDTIPN